MNINKSLIKISLRKILGRPAPERIPLDARRAELNDYYVCVVNPVYLNWSGWVESIQETGVMCHLHYSNGEIRHLSWAQLKESTLVITHYYKGYRFSYGSLVNMIFWEYTGAVKLRVIYDKVCQYIFNKKNLIRAGRIEVLKYLVNKECERPAPSYSHVTIFNETHGVRAFSRPDIQSQLRYYRLICDSLVETGELASNTNGYSVTARAMASLSEYEEQERKHKEILRQSVLVAILTAALVVVGLLQVMAITVQ